MNKHEDDCLCRECYDTATLLRTAYALTHRIHADDRRRSQMTDEVAMRVHRLRCQRNAIDDEILRRAGE